MARILVIDDESNIRIMIRLALRHVGHTVELAIDGPEGLRMYRKGEKWDLVLLDQRMPEMMGLDVLKEIRRRNPAARIIMITAFGTVDLAVEAMKAGATDFLRKPFTAETLRGAVTTALRDLADTESAADFHTLTYASTTLNGFRIEYDAGPVTRSEDGFRFVFTLRNPEGASQTCEVQLPAYVIELIKAETDCEQLPGGDRFWQTLCESVVANYVWQNSDFPPAGTLTVNELSAGLRRWIDAVMHGGEAP